MLTYIVQTCEADSCFFTRQRNAPILLGFGLYQKISTAMRVIAYGILADYTDEYLSIREDTTLRCVWLFVKVLIRVFSDEFLEALNEDDTKKLMAMVKQVDDRACLEVWTECTGGGRTAPRLSTCNTLIIVVIEVLCLKQWTPRIF